MQSQRLSARERLVASAENHLMAHLVPRSAPGPFFRTLFRLPLLFARMGLFALVPPHTLIITTTGRRTGHPHSTPVEYFFDADHGAYRVMAGWEGRTDWYRNARANPRVTLQFRDRRVAARAEPVSDEDVAGILEAVTRLNPRASAMWARWSEAAMDGTHAAYMAAAPHFPALHLYPVDVTLGETG